ncbi:hypothetical protein [Stieleria varia]|nr:hypothetical protein [Stieleria varia]
MASEIRVLEDQLYDADYQNRVLRDKLERLGAQQKNSVTPTPYAPLVESSREPLPPQPKPYPTESYHTDPYDLPPDSDPSATVDDGKVVVPPTTTPRESTPPTRAPDSSSRPLTEPEQIPTPDPTIMKENEDAAANPSTRDADDNPFPAEKETEPRILPPPNRPEPPGPSSLEVKPIIPGELIPPGVPEPDPPGKIELPDDAKVLLDDFAPQVIDPNSTSGIPDHLELHRGLSGGHQMDEDDEVDGVFLVVNALDDDNRVVDLSKFDIDATLTVVAVDPTIASDDQRIGRWEFTADEVREMIKTQPVNGLHVSIPWSDQRPAGDELILHVRLKAADEEMICQGKVSLAPSVAMSNWLPRGGAKR